MAAPNMTAPMSVDSDTMKSQYCLLFWYDGERNWSIQSSLTIFAPRKDVYQPGELVKAKFTGKLYRAAIVRTEESKEVLKEEAAKFEELLKDESLSANLVLQKMGLEVDLGSSKKDPVSIRKKSEKRTRPDVNLDSKGTKGDHAVPEGGDVVQNAVAEDDHAISAGVKRARLLFGSTEESVSTTAKTVSLTASTLEEVTVSKGSQENMDTSQHSRPPCRHCRNKCRCSSIASLKTRVEELEKLIPRLEELEKKFLQSQSPALQTTTPTRPLSQPSPTPVSSITTPTRIPHSITTTPSSQPLSISSPTPSTSGAGVNTHRDAPDVQMLLASLHNVPKTDVAGTIKKLALSVFSREDLCECSLSGKRSIFSKDGARPALDAKLVGCIELAASQHLSVPFDRRLFVDKFQNVQKHIRATMKNQKSSL